MFLNNMFYVIADCFKRDLTQIMLKLACVCLGNFFINTEHHKELGQCLVPVSILEAIAIPDSVSVIRPSLSMVI